ncbi:MAG: NUDIX hydrolase [Simplicispira suum]|uniref:NUDIX hydrolase n=1 Tax=Simplicispira suum TaxID=2109915 RepID=UPI001C6C7EA5|nr:NUDIX hydrolase [Simplicispira suum]MBW7834167.1 NUDIX hydrolase [Simplicispira suum]
MHAAPPTSQESPRDSASVVLLQDGAAGMQVLLLRRHAKASNMAGIYVFPGGKLEREDHFADGSTHLDQPLSTLAQQLSEDGTTPATAAALYVAALREALEECGLLLAEPQTADRVLDASDARKRLRGGQAFTNMLETLALRLQTRALRPWSRWITPVAPSMSTRRFDTRFFVARAPAGQVARHDDEETVDTLWIAPRTALEQYRDGAIDLAPPQIMSLAHLARYASVEQVLEAASCRRPPTILPQAFDDGETRVICYPGDARHAVRERALPGPTCLQYRERRFFPEKGFDALFD